MNKIIRNLRANKHGFTLVEALVGGLVLAVCAMIMVSGFLTAFSFIRRGIETRNKGLAASSVIEGATEENIFESTVSDVTMTYQIDSVTYEVSGSMNTAYDDTSSVGFTVFVPDN